MNKSDIYRWLIFIVSWFGIVFLYTTIDHVELVWRFVWSWVPAKPERVNFASDVSFVVASGMISWYMSIFVLKQFNSH